MQYENTYQQDVGWYWMTNVDETCHSVQSLSRVQLCYPMDCSTPGLNVHHQLPELVQTHVHRMVIPPTILSSAIHFFCLSQHQGLFQWVNSSQQVAKILEFQLQHQSFQWIFRVDFPLGWTGLISLQSKGLLRVFFNITILKHQFFATQLSYSPTLTFLHDYWKNHGLD